MAHTLDVSGLGGGLGMVGEMVPVGHTEAVMHHNPVPATPEGKRRGASTEERTLRAMKSPNLFAFNKYAVS